MNVQVKSSGGISLVPIDSRIMSDRKIFIEGEITRETAMEFMKKVIVLTNEDNSLPIDVVINSCGGEIESGLMMYDVIQTSVCPLRMFCTGCAYSMAAVIFASGKHGRYILPHSRLMLHEPLIGNKINGSASNIRSISDSLLSAKAMLNQILSAHTGNSIEIIEEATSYDHYFNAQDSISFGLADKIFGFDNFMKGELPK